MYPPCTCTTPFGLPVVPGGVEDEQRIFGVHVFGRTFGRKLHQLAEIDFARAGGLKGFGIAREDDDLLDRLQSVERLIHNAFQRNRLAAAEAGVADDDDLAPARLRCGRAARCAQSGVDHRVDRSDARASQHGDHALKRQRHVDDDAVALLHAQRLQSVGKAADIAIELADR